MNRTVIMKSIQWLVDLSIFWTQERDGSINREFHNWNSCSFDNFDFFERWVIHKELLQILKSNSYFLALWNILHLGENSLVYSNIDVTVFDCDAVSTTSKKFNWDVVVT